MTNSFYSIDLTKPWASDTPAWTRHAPGPALWRSSICSSADGSRIVAFANGGGSGGGGGNNGTGVNDSSISVYSTAKDAWYPVAGTLSPHHLTEVRCVTSVDDDRVYVAGGLADSQAMTMDVFSFESESLSTVDMPTLGMMAGRVSYAGVWLKIRSSILFFGGYTNKGFMPSSMIEYSPKDSNWKDELQNTPGGPTSLVDHCMAADDKGTKVFIYGGRSQWDGPAQGAFYIYDVGLQTWTQGPSIGRRLYASCAAVGDYFLLFGGTEDPFTNTPADMGKETLPVHIFKVSTNTWVNDYVPGGSSSGSSGRNGGSSSSGGMPGQNEDDSGIRISTNVGLIVGAIGAGIILLGAMITVYFYLRSKDKRRIKHQQLQESRRPSFASTSMATLGRNDTPSAMEKGNGFA
ncbi:hypothetical protein DFQ26_003326 [Actinomortierella ambigua]|nr:hypothetical protein DFQ26_003326 [Actinomortierella ambigua]